MENLEEAINGCQSLETKGFDNMSQVTTIRKLIEAEMKRQQNAREKLEKLGRHFQKMGDSLGENTYSVFHRGQLSGIRLGLFEFFAPVESPDPLRLWREMGAW